MQRSVSEIESGSAHNRRPGWPPVLDVSVRSRLSIRAFTDVPLQLWADVDFAADARTVFRLLSCPKALPIEGLSTRVGPSEPSATRADIMVEDHTIHSDEPWAHVVWGRTRCRGTRDFLAGMFFEPLCGGGCRMIWQICFRSINWRGFVAPFALRYVFNERLRRLDGQTGRRSGKLRIA